MLKKIWKKISTIGFKEGMSNDDKKEIVLLNRLSLLIIVFFLLIAIMTYVRFNQPIIGNLYVVNALVVAFCFFITKLGKPDLSRYIISFFMPISIVFVGAYAKSQGVTDNVILYLSPRMLLTMTLFAPLLLFGYKHLKKTIIAIIPGFIVFVLYDKIHQLFGIHMENLKFEPQYYSVFLFMIIIFLFFVIVSILFLQGVNLKNETKLAELNNDLLASEEELKQQNEELKVANESLKQQKEIVAKQNQELKKLQTAIDQSANTVVITDINGTITFVNKKFRDLTGYTKEEALGKPTKILKSGYHNDNFYKNLWDTINAGNVWSGIFKNRKKNGELYWEQTTITPIKDVNNRIISFVAVKEDITDRIKKEEELKNAYKIIKEKNDAITNSLNYAKHIQNSILPDSDILERYFNDYFIFNKPANTVGGDFYYLTEIENYLFVAVADCTGHGIPGGFMTMLGHSFIEEVINIKKVLETDQILNELRKMVINAFKQNNFSSKSQDGMDLSICRFDKETYEMQFSGANQKILYIRENKKYKVIKGDKMPIGIYPLMTTFTSKTFKIQKNEKIYLFTDGFADEFGGPKNQKYYSKNFINFLVSIQDKPMNEQKKLLEQELDNWLGNNKQIDDILVIGIDI